MSLISYALGQTSIILRVKILSSASTTGGGLTGLTNTSTGLNIAAIADTEATTTAYTQAGSTIQTIATLGTYAAPSSSDCRFKEVDSTNHPGVYELQFANARFAVSGSKSLLISISGAANAVQCDVVIPLVALNPYAAINTDGSGYILLSNGTGTGQIELTNGEVTATNGGSGGSGGSQQIIVGPV